MTRDCCVILRRALDHLSDGELEQALAVLRTSEEAAPVALARLLDPSSSSPPQEYILKLQRRSRGRPRISSDDRLDRRVEVTKAMIEARRLESGKRTKVDDAVGLVAKKLDRSRTSVERDYSVLKRHRPKGPSDK